ncbi:Polo-like serine/threonine protein kinase, partial [Pseudoloma neurophilia]
MSKKIEYYFKPSDIIKDPDTNLIFTIQKFLGKGAFAQCFSAKLDLSNVNFNKLKPNDLKIKELQGISRVCLKIVKKSEISSDRLREKLSSEIYIQKSLNHKNIVKLFHTFANDIFIFMIMEVCDSSLSDLLKQNKKIRESHTKKFILQLLSSIEYLHSVNVVHRDIKLSNILLSNYTIKLADFGLCALIQKNKRTTVCGTPNYIAPEIIAKTAYSFECDIWSIGVLIYTMLIGIPPFQKKTAKEIYFSIKKNEWTIPDNCLISNEAKDLISKLLVRDPDGRLTITKIYEHSFFTKKDSLINNVMKNILNDEIILINKENYRSGGYDIKGGKEYYGSHNYDSQGGSSIKGGYDIKGGKEYYGSHNYDSQGGPTLKHCNPQGGSNENQVMNTGLNTTVNTSITDTTDTVIFCIYLTKINGLGYKMKSNRFGIYFLNGDSIIKKSENIYVFITSTIENNKKVLRKEEHSIINQDSFNDIRKGDIFIDYFNKLGYLIEKFGQKTQIIDLPFTFVVRVRRLNGLSTSSGDSFSGTGYLLGLWNNTLVFSFGSAIITVIDGKYVDCTNCEYH